MNAKVYVETTVISYLAARPTRDLVVAARQEVTQEWWTDARANFDLYVSQLVVDEAAVGDKAVAARRMDILEGIPLLQLRPEVLELARDFLDDGAIPRGSGEDALHVALATVHDMDYLLTWNCAHIANAHMRNAIIAAANRRGYECPVICTPEELTGERA